MPRRATVILPLFGLLALCSTGCSMFAPTDQNVIGQANQMHGSLEPAIIRDAEVQRYMDAVGDRIVRGAIEYNEDGKTAKAQRNQDNEWMYDGSVRFHLVNSKTLNAFTTGGTHIYIYNQLFQDARSEDELAAVMAHEFAHVYGRHVHNGMKRQYGVVAAALAGGALGYVAGGENAGQYASLGAGAGGALGQFFTQGYTREDENEADKLGFSFYIRAGWDPDRFSDFFKQMIEKGYDRPSQGSDHPALSERVRNTEDRVARMSADARRWEREPIADRREFEAIKRRAIEAARDLPNDQSLAAAQLMFRSFPSCVTPEEQPEQKDAQQQLLQVVEESERRRAR